MSLERRLRNIVLLFVAILALGTVGYALIEGWPPLDALYMAIITVTTVGFAEVQPLTPGGKLFTSALILLGVGVITYSFSALTNYVIAGEVRGVIEERRMRRQIESLDGHHLVCGFGRVGREVCIELEREGQALVVIDTDPEAIEQARGQGYPVVAGDAGRDQTLQEAGIERAKGLVAAVGTDADNLLVVLSARTLNPTLDIVARATSQDAEAKLLRAGADRVMSPYSLGGRRLAQMLLRPDVVNFLDVVMHDESLELFMENLFVGSDCPLVDKTIGEAHIREQIGANILGIKRGEGIVVSPDPSIRLGAGDVLVALGTRQQLKALATLVDSS